LRPRERGRLGESILSSGQSKKKKKKKKNGHLPNIEKSIKCPKKEFFVFSFFRFLQYKVKINTLVQETTPKGYIRTKSEKKKKK
jgi:hypothetical protein